MRKKKKKSLFAKCIFVIPFKNMLYCTFKAPESKNLNLFSSNRQKFDLLRIFVEENVKKAVFVYLFCSLSLCMQLQVLE